MFAVVTKVKINDAGSGQQELQDKVVPAVSQIPGFVAGYWTRKDDSGLSMVIFESEDVAKQASERVREMAPDSVEVQDVEVREVAAHA